MPASKPPAPPSAEHWPSLLPVGDFAGKSAIAMTRSSIIVGSRQDAHLPFVSSTVSRNHAIILISVDGRAYIRDLNSRTHVYVNGEEVREAELNEGDLLRVGRFTLQYQSPQSPSEGVDVPPAAPPARLEVAGANRVLLEGRVTLIGRRDGSDVTIDDDKVSTAHAVIYELDGKRWIRDLASANGTWVNGKKQRSSEIKDGDTIKCGQTIIKYVHHAAAPAVKRAAAPLEAPASKAPTAPLASPPAPLAAAAPAPTSADELPPIEVEPEDTLSARESDLGPISAGDAEPAYGEPARSSAESSGVATGNVELEAPETELTHSAPAPAESHDEDDAIPLEIDDQPAAGQVAESESPSSKFEDLARELYGEEVQREAAAQPPVEIDGDERSLETHVAATDAPETLTSGGESEIESTGQRPEDAIVFDEPEAIEPSMHVVSDAASDPLAEPLSSTESDDFDLLRDESPAADHPESSAGAAIETPLEDVLPVIGLDRPDAIELDSPIDSAEPATPTPGDEPQLAAGDAANEGDSFTGTLEVDGEAAIEDTLGRADEPEPAIPTAGMVETPSLTPEEEEDAFSAIVGEATGAGIELTPPSELVSDQPALGAPPVTEEPLADELADTLQGLPERAIEFDLDHEPEPQVIEEVRPFGEAGDAETPEAKEPASDTLGDSLDRQDDSPVEVPLDDVRAVAPEGIAEEILSSPLVGAVPASEVDDLAIDALQETEDPSRTIHFDVTIAPAGEGVELAPASEVEGLGDAPQAPTAASEDATVPLDIDALLADAPSTVEQTIEAPVAVPEAPVAAAPAPPMQAEPEPPAPAPPVAVQFVPISSPARPSGPAVVDTGKTLKPGVQMLQIASAGLQVVQLRVDPAMSPARPAPTAAPPAPSATGTGGLLAEPEVSGLMPPPDEPVSLEPEFPGALTLPLPQVAPESAPACPADEEVGSLMPMNDDGVDVFSAHVIDESGPSEAEDEAEFEVPGDDGDQLARQPPLSDGGGIFGPPPPSASKPAPKQLSQWGPLAAAMVDRQADPARFGASRPYQDIPRPAPAQPKGVPPKAITQPAPAPPRRSRFRILAYVLLMLVLMAAAAWAVWQFVLPRVLVEGALHFHGLARLSEADLSAFGERQKSAMRDNLLRSDAAAILHGIQATRPAAPGVKPIDPGFLADPDAFGTTLAAQWSAHSSTGRGTLAVSFRGTEPEADASRLQALLRALHDAANRPRAGEVEALRRRVEEKYQTMANARRELNELRALKQRILGEGAPDGSGEAAIREAVTAAHAAWNQALDVRTRILAEVERLKHGASEGAAATNAKDAPDAPLGDLLRKLADVEQRLEKTRDEGTKEMAAAREALNQSIDQFQQNLAGMAAMNDDPKLAEFLASARRLRDDGFKVLNDQLLRQEQQQQLLAGFKKRLETAAEERRLKLFETDENLKVLRSLRNQATRNRVLAQDEGRTRDAVKFNEDIKVIEENITKRKIELSEDRFSDDAIKQIEEIIATGQKNLAADRTGTDKMMAELEGAFRRTSPEAAGLNEAQRTAAAALERRLEKMAEARKSYNDAAAAQQARLDEQTRRLEADAGELKTQIALRRKELAEEQQRRMTAPQAALVQEKERELEQAEAAEAAARQLYLDKLKEQEGSATRLAARRQSLANDQKEIAAEPAVVARLDAAQRELEEAEAAAGATPTALPPDQPRVTVLDPQRRPLYMAGAVGGVALVFMLLLMLTGHRPHPAAELSAEDEGFSGPDELLADAPVDQHEKDALLKN